MDMIDTDKIKELISQSESETLEFKRDVPKGSIRVIAKNIAAMANSSGGYIIIGVDERSGIVGATCTITKDDFKDFFRPEPDFAIEEKEIDGKRIVVIKVEKSIVPILFKDVLYRKNHSHIELATENDVRAIFKDRNYTDLTKVVADMNASIERLQNLLIINDRVSHRATVKWSIISMCVGVGATIFFGWLFTVIF